MVENTRKDNLTAVNNMTLDQLIESIDSGENYYIDGIKASIREVSIKFGEDGNLITNASDLNLIHVSIDCLGDMLKQGKVFRVA